MQLNITIMDEQHQEVDNRKDEQNVNVQNERQLKFEKLTQKEIDEKYDPKKNKSLLLSASYERIGRETDRRSFVIKSENVCNCGTFLKYINGNLVEANFCKDRLCPMCIWRKSLKIFGEMSAVMDKIDEESRFIFLTLTIKSVGGDELSGTIDDLFKGFKKLMLRKEIKRVVKGWFRALEITYNADKDTYHPHFHLILQVHKNYFGKNYIKQSDYLKIWREAMKLDYDPQVDVRKVSKKKADIEGVGAVSTVNGYGEAVAESAKYTVKDTDYIYSDDDELTDKVVEVLACSMKGRRLIAYGGDLKKIHSEVEKELDDKKNESEKLRDDVRDIVTTYHWRVGYGYVKGGK